MAEIGAYRQRTKFLSFSLDKNLIPLPKMDKNMVLLPIRYVSNYFNQTFTPLSKQRKTGDQTRNQKGQGAENAN